ncbi:peroxisome proliferator-activated receptor gamma coactivator-related protein 1 isoform X1 [Malaclemys terrapin pileata]|uniref:peroxisome proliferator-activated receptor gamma coactivator-related protein 1 isoform X1 n=1 Tax=Malaclemys terrapin pileata TaxID=2991368 RepID=UPI0023A7AD3C|nr:peroxisome proliferator-activated receptor gamma coactivator-related protein 1 isoform X1 [Malaclemys terrapin pileata]
MQSYLDSSMISIIEDFGTLTENKACLDAPNELSLLTAITEILDSTDDETLSPFDTTLDSELLALPRERESSSFQKFLSLSRASPERSVPALDDPWGLSGPAAIGKLETGPVDLPWNRPLSCLEEPAAPKPRPSRAPRAERKLPRPQPLPQRSDGEEEEEAASPGQPGGVAVTGGLRESPMDLCAKAGGEETAWPEDTDTPCIISTGAGSLSELVKSMHPYCLPTLTVCLDPASEPVAKEFLTGPLLLEIVPGEGESLEIPVVLQQLRPGAQLPAEGEGASGCLAGEGDGALEPLPTDGVMPVGMPTQGCETGGPVRAPQEDTTSPTQERESPRGVDPEAKDEARQRDQDLESSSQHSTEAPVGRKRQGTEKGRGRERARKSRKKKREESQKGQAKPDGDCAVRRLRSTSAVLPPATQRSPSRAARPSVQVSTFLEKQLEQAKKEGQMELRSARGRPRAAAAGGGLQRKGRPEVLEAEKPNTQPAVQSAETPGPSERAVPSPGEQPAAVGPGPAEQGEGAPGCSEGSRPAPTKGSVPPHDDLSAGGEAAGWPSKPRALSLTEYRLRMLRRQPSGADEKEGEKQAASKWPSIPEPPTELAEIPCLMAPVRPPPSQPAQPVETPSSQRGPEKTASPPATPPLARKAPAGPPQTLPAPVPPGLQLPVLPPALGAAAAVIPLASPAPYALYPPVPSWPCFGPPPATYPSLPPPPAAGGTPNAFHLVPGLPPPAVTWPTPALPPPPFGPGVSCAPMGWPLGLQPSYWPGVPLPPPVPPMVYSDPGAALQSPGPNPFPGSPAALAPSCQEPSAFTAQPMKPVLASQATGAAKHEVPAQPPQRGPQPSGRASDPRRQSRPVGESPAAQPVGRPPIATARTMGESTAAWPVGQPPASQPVGQPPAPQPVGEPPASQPVGKSSAQPPIVTTQTVGESVSAAAPRPVEESTAARPVGQPPAQPTRQPPAPRPVGEPPAPRPVGEPPAQPTRQPPVTRPVGEPPAPQPVGEPPAPQPVGEPPAQPMREPPAPQPVGQPPAQPTREPPVTRPVGQPPASQAVAESSAAQPPIATALPVGESVSAAAPQPMGDSTAARPVRDPPAQPTRESPAPRPVGAPPATCPRAEAAAPAKVPVPSLLEGARPDPKGAVLQDPRPPGHTSIPGKAGALLRVREESQPTKPAPAQPWRHQPLISPAQPGARKDIVQAFISEIGIEASDLSSLLEQFEKTEATKEELHVRRPRDRLAPGNAGSESHQDKNPPDSLHAPELANVAGLTPPATPPHQLWKPLAAVSLLGKPGAAPQEGSQRTAKFMEAKPLPQSKPRGKGPPPTTCGPPPSHVGSGDHDYCVRGSAQPEEGARLPGTPAPSELGSRWNVKHHQDITIKLPSSLSTRTLAWPGLNPQPGAAPGSSEQLDHRTSAQSQVAAGRSSPPTSVLLSPDASPCRDEEPQTRDPQPKQLAAKRSLRCYRRRGASPSPRARASRSFSSTSSGASASSSSSSSSSRSRSRSLSPPPKRWRRYRSRRSRSSHSSSRSSCGSCGRSRGRSSSSSSSYSSRSSSASRSRSRSPSPCRRSNRRRRYDYGDPPDHCQHPKVLHKERAIEERRVVFIGKIPSRMTRAELRHRFSVFGDIEECTLHFRAEGDNYGFVTYRYAKEAFAAIESGHKLRRPDEQPFDLCFGGRRQFCRRNYADLDSNREDLDPVPIKSKFDSLDFDTLLKQAQRNLRR